MSDIIRRLMGVIPPRPEVAQATSKELARLCHQAEDTDNDVLLVEVTAEVESREQRLPGATAIFMQWYWILWAKRKPTA